MGAFTGSISTRRYRVLGRPGRDYADTFTAGVRAHTLIPLDPKKNPREEKSIGWCAAYDENDLDLSFEKFYLDGRVVLSLRMDVIKPPAGQVKRALAQRQREEEARRKAPLSAAALRELKEQVVAELRVKTPPRVKTVDMVWRLDEQVLYFYSQSKGLNETFTDLFAQTFGVPIDLEGPGVWAQDLCSEEDTEDQLQRVKPTAELLGGFMGLRPGTRVLEEHEQAE